MQFGKCQNLADARRNLIAVQLSFEPDDAAFSFEEARETPHRRLPCRSTAFQRSTSPYSTITRSMAIVLKGNVTRAGSRVTIAFAFLEYCRVDAGRAGLPDR